MAERAAAEVRELMIAPRLPIGREWVGTTHHLAYTLQNYKGEFAEEWSFIHRMASSNYHRYEELY